jgi:alkanesulfonate monooxygenase SsuD/methylene tetrahydromethanopterin reductase-like flavin-dependent oxidoreductase (luciferase family)
MHGNPAIRIYTATITPASIRNSAEVADGMFPIFMNPERFDLFEPHLAAGFAKAGNGKGLASYDICPFVPVSLNDDLDAARLPIKRNLALYIGGMGAREKNFYNDYAKRLGYEDAAVRIQDAFLGGAKDAAVAAVPDALVDEIALVGPAARIRDRLQAWQEAGRRRHVHAMLLGANADAAAMRVIAEAVL